MPPKPEERRALWIFTPSRTDPADLERIFVQRQELLKDAVERVRESALTGHKHHQLFVGPRGCGKTHFITLLVSRVGQEAELADRLRIAWLNEDETCTTLLELLLKIHAALEKRHPQEFAAEAVAPVYEKEPREALAFVQQHLLRTLGTRTLLVVVENLDAIFEGLGNAGQRDLRAFLQQHPQFCIAASAQRLVDELADRASPFFGFFQTEHFKPLKVEEATELLKKIAALQGENEVVEFLATSRGRSRVRALHHLSGGNHRIYLVLSQFITRDSIDALVAPFMKMVDELTPYYQERLRWLPMLQRKIVEHLCLSERTVPVKDIAKRLFSSPQTISSQLQGLREKGYVESVQRGRESLYELSEPLMRLCVEVKDNQNLQPLRLLVDFLRVWYEDEDMKQRLGKLAPGSTGCEYLKVALERNSTEGNLRKRILVEQLERMLPEGKALSPGLKRIASNSETAAMAYQLWQEGRRDEALRCLEEGLAEETNISAKADLWLCQSSLQVESQNWAQVMRACASVLEAAGTAIEQRAIALIDRGVCHSRMGEPQRALADLTQVIEMPGAPVDQVAFALYNRGVCHAKTGEPQRAIGDYTQVIEMPGAPEDQVARALYNRAVCHGETGNLQREMEDYTRVIEMLGAPVDTVALALFNRGVGYREMGDPQRAMEDYTQLIEMPGAPVDQVAMALFNRGVGYHEMGQPQRAMGDYTQLIEMPGAPVDQVAKALLNRGVGHREMGQPQRAIADYTQVTEMAGAPVDQVADALYNRGVCHGQTGELQPEMADYTQVIEMVGAPVGTVAQAHYNRGVCHLERGELERAMADYTHTVEMEGGPADQVAIALNGRGVCHWKMDEPEGALADFTRIIEMAGAPVDQVARALYNRGVCHRERGELQRAMADYTQVIEMARAPVDQVAKALLNRALIHESENQPELRRADLKALAELTDAPADCVVDAWLELADSSWTEGRWEEGFRHLSQSLERGAAAQPVHHRNPRWLLGVLFSAGLGPEARAEKVRQMLQAYAGHGVTAHLGDGLVQHVGDVFKAGTPFPSTDNLESWAVAWEAAGAEVPEFRLPLRLLRTGIDFLKTGGKDQGILLDLTTPERRILKQALGLEEMEKE